MPKILVNDGMHSEGQQMLEAAGFEVHTEKIAQADLPAELPNFEVVLVRSATKIRKELIDQCPNLKMIGRGGVGMDNIDVDYGRSKGIEVFNTPAASSQAVAELAFGHFFSLARFLHRANREMPTGGHTEFKQLKKSYSKGFQLRGRSIGIIGFGRIGQETARIALGMGMRVLPVDPYVKSQTIDLQLHADMGSSLSVEVPTVPMADMLAQADMISLHVPSMGKPLLGAEEMAQMKDGVILVNTARGGSIDEDALLAALESGKVGAAGLDVFENEPTPRTDLLNHPRISVTPHIGASTQEAQRNIGLELAQKIMNFYQVKA